MKSLLVVAAIILVLFLFVTVRRNVATQRVEGGQEDLNTRRKLASGIQAGGAAEKRDQRIKFASPFQDLGEGNKEHVATLHGTPAKDKQVEEWNVNNRLANNEQVHENGRINEGQGSDKKKQEGDAISDKEKEEHINSVNEGVTQDLHTSDNALDKSDKKDQVNELLVDRLKQKDGAVLQNLDTQHRVESTTSPKFHQGNSASVDEPDKARISDGPNTSAPTTTTKPDLMTLMPPMPTFYPSKDLFVRAVYFDARPRDGHQNTSVFLVVCVRNITDNNLIVGCQVDENKASKFSVKLIGETPLWRAFYPKINHEEVLVHCYDLPVRNGSSAYITYKMTENSDIVTAASERPLVIPPPRIKPTSPEGIKYNMTVVTCAKIFNEPPWLQEWLTYQKTLGVDHVHLDVEDTFVSSGGLKRSYVDQMMKDGFLSVDIWKKYLGMWEIWYHNQGLVYEDCPYRFLGTYDYIVMLDTDDFFTPREPNELKIHYYINKYCRRNGVGSCKFKWVEYFPDVYGFNNKSTSDGNITRALRSYSHYFQGNPKSLHRTTALIDTATHYAYLMMPQYKFFDVPLSTAYVAHVRKFKRLPDIGLVDGVPNSCLDHCISRIFVFMEVCLVCVIFNLLGWSQPFEFQF